jgi:hypothetical protein
MRFPLLASLASAGIFVLILSSILGTCVLPLLLPVMPSEDKEGLESNLKQEQIPPSASQYPAQERERRRRSRSEKRSKERKVSFRLSSVAHRFNDCANRLKWKLLYKPSLPYQKALAEDYAGVLQDIRFHPTRIRLLQRAKVIFLVHHSRRINT